MAHKKGQGSTRNGRDSNPQFRGVKRYGGEHVSAGTILVRQCGTVFHPAATSAWGRTTRLYARRRRHGALPSQRQAFTSTPQV